LGLLPLKINHKKIKNLKKKRDFLAKIKQSADWLVDCFVVRCVAMDFLVLQAAAAWSTSIGRIANPL